MIVKAPSKCILFGEHAVVHSHQAICTTLGLYTTASLSKSDQNHLLIPQMGIDTRKCLGSPTTKAFFFLVKELQIDGVKVTVTTEIPIGMGLGSSASFATALSLLLLTYKSSNPDKSLVNEYALELEKIFHGNSSGLDNTTICYGGSNIYTKDGGLERIVTPRVKLFLVDTRIWIFYCRDRKEYQEAGRDVQATDGHLSRGYEGG